MHKSFLQIVQEKGAQRVAHRAAMSLAEQREWDNRLTPLETRVAKILDALPSETRDQGVALESIRRLLAGKWRGNCQAGELGAAMRKNNWVRRRNWSTSLSGFRALWFPLKEAK